MTTRWHYWVIFVDTFRAPQPLEFNCETWAEFWTLLQQHVEELGAIQHIIRIP